MNVSDARVRGTRQALRQSFLTLLREKPVGKISVTELCRVCGINRATFYHHYTDIFDLLAGLEQEVLDDLEKMFLRQRGLSMREIFLQTLYALRTAGAEWWVLGSENGDPALFAKMLVAVYEANFPRMQKKTAHLPVQTQAWLYQYLSQGSGSVIRQWIASGAHEPPEQLADFLSQTTNWLMNQFAE